MKIGKLSSFESKFVRRLRELTVGMDDEYLARWQRKAEENFEEERPYTVEESEDRKQGAIYNLLDYHQCTGEELMLAREEGREPRPIQETDPEFVAALKRGCR